MSESSSDYQSAVTGAMEDTATYNSDDAAWQEAVEGKNDK